MKNIQYTLQYLADFLAAEIRGDKNCVITGIAPLDKATTSQISFLKDPHYKKYLAVTKAAAIIIKPEQAATVTTNALLCDNPYACYAKITALFENAPKRAPGIHPSAVIGENCEIDSSAFIGAHCFLGDRVKIGKNVIINAGCSIENDSSIDENSKLYANVTVYHAVKIGKRTIIHSGVVIGSDGFGTAIDKGVWYKIHQLGSVEIGDDVEIGSNTTIDRGALENTIIENDVKLDNQIQIGHNVRIGAHTVISGCTGIAGSTTIGQYCMIGGGVGISGHIEIADKTIITAGSAIDKTITKAGIYASGIPAMPHRIWWKNLARLSHLDETIRKLQRSEKQNNE